MTTDWQPREQARDEFIIAAVFEVKKETSAETCKLDYHGGGRHPRLVHDESKPELRSHILKAKQRLNVVESESEIL